MLRLSSKARLFLRYSDDNPFGGPLSRRLDAALHQSIPQAARLLRESGMRAVVAATNELLGDRLRPGPGPLGSLYRSDQEIRSEYLFPSPECSRPARLVLDVEDRGPQVLEMERGLWPELACWMGEWQQGACRPLAPQAARLWDQLRDLGALVESPAPMRAEGSALFVGHASVRLGLAGGSVLVDPFLAPQRRRYQAHGQPLGPSELLPDAVLITHSHPDHYDPGSLLRFGADCPIYVPAVPRESILVPDMEARLAELGFRAVRSVYPEDRFSVGPARVTVLPFHGEQPTSTAVLHPEVRNVGATYLVETDGGRFGICADGGCDAGGDVRRVALSARRRHGRADAVFGGFRSWALYPITYLFSSVARYLLLVPRELWNVRQAIMNGPDELLDTAEAWDARCVVPYANGGAPWHEELGLGPRRADSDQDNPHVDPFPERVEQAASRRSTWQNETIPSGIRVALLKAGENLVWQQ